MRKKIFYGLYFCTIVSIFPKAKHLPKSKNTKPLWVEYVDVSPVTDAKVYVASQFQPLATMYIRCAEGKINVWYFSGDLLFSPIEFAYRVDKQDPRFDFDLVESDNSKAVGLWYNDAALRYLDTLIAAKGKVLSIEIKHRYGTLREVFLLEELITITSRAREYCVTPPSPE